MTDSPELFFSGKINDQLVASCMAGYDGHRGWIYFLAVAKSQRRNGLAAKLVAHVEAKLLELGCPKLELMVRENNLETIAFYEAIGFRLDPVKVLSKRLSDDVPHDFTSGKYPPALKLFVFTHDLHLGENFVQGFIKNLQLEWMHTLDIDQLQ